MNKLFKFLLLPGVAVFLFYSCKKDETLSVLKMGAAFTELSATTTTLVLDSTNAANTNAITLNWPAVNYGEKVAVTYTLQLDSINDNFIKPVNISLGNNLSKSFSVLDFNNLVISLGLVPAVAGQIHARVISDVNQSNGLVSSVPTVYSNILTLNVTPYSTKPTPKYPVPDNLYLVGDASPGGWNNPVPIPSQQFTKIDDNTFGMVIQLTGGNHYVLLPKNGDWSHKYSVPGTPDPMQGEFVPDASKDIPAPPATGLYKIIIDFVKATYTVTPAAAGDIPQNLYIVGDATAGLWANPVPVPSQQFTQISSGEFSLTIPLTSGKSYVFLPLNGDWAHKYGGNDKMGGALLKDSSVPASNTPAPDVSGTYTINVNFFSNMYSVK
jgi:starch-binding outer membrane protein SusE/F